MKFAYIVKIHAGCFNDVVVSMKPTIQGAVADGLRHYRKTALRPNEMRPEIHVEPTVVVGP